MAANINAKIGKLSADQRKQVETRASELIAEEMTLRELPSARKLRRSGSPRTSVSRLEKRSGLLLSTLRKTVEAMGGDLSPVARFPDRPPVVLPGESAGASGGSNERTAHWNPEQAPSSPLEAELRR